MEVYLTIQQHQLQDCTVFLNIFYEKWRYIKYISGLDKKAFEKNTPKNGVVDRLLIRRYPHNTGFLETHVDIDVNVRIVSGVFMSKKFKDYDEGGIYLFNKKNKKIDIEKKIDVGDMSLFYATLKHGVDRIIDYKKSNKDEKKRGRWWVCLTNPESDEIKNRSSHIPIK